MTGRREYLAATRKNLRVIAANASPSLSAAAELAAANAYAAGWWGRQGRGPHHQPVRETGGTMTTTDIGINWERKFLDQTAANIRLKAELGQKVADAQLELDQANHRIADLAKQVKDLTPAGERLTAARKKFTADKAEYEARLDAKDAKIRELTAKLHRGQKGVINDVLRDLQARYAGMPDPIPGEVLES